MARNTYITLNKGFLVLCLNSFIPASAPNGPKNPEAISAASLTLYLSFTALRLSAPNRKKDAPFNTR